MSIVLVSHFSRWGLLLSRIWSVMQQHTLLLNHTRKVKENRRMQLYYDKGASKMFPRISTKKARSAILVSYGNPEDRFILAVLWNDTCVVDFQY